MCRLALAAVAVLFAGLAVSAQAQSLIRAPESVVFDSVQNRYFISNTADGNIIQIDAAWDTTIFATGLVWALGSVIVGDTLLVVDQSGGLNGFDLVTGNWLFEVYFPLQGRLNDCAADTSGYVYVTDPGANAVRRMRLSDLSTATVATGVTNLSGIAFDRRNNRLIVGAWYQNPPIREITLPDHTVSIIKNTLLRTLDGISEDNEGNFYLSSFEGCSIYRWGNDFSGDPALVSAGHNLPARISYNKEYELVAVPNWGNSLIEYIDISAPAIRVESYTLDDSGADGDGVAEPGESVELYITLYNYRRDAANVTGTLSCSDPQVSITNSTASFTGNLALGQKAQNTAPFTFSASTPDPSVLAFQLLVAADGGYVSAESLVVFVGTDTGFSDGCESGEGNWKHKWITVGFEDEWHLDSFRSHSGSAAWKVGGSGQDDYSNAVDAALITPPFRLGENDTLSFWHWIDAENIGASLGADGGIVMISVGGGEWTQITPLGEGYTYYMTNDPAKPLPAYTPCFSGKRDWEKVAFDLSAYSGWVQIMFRFISDILVTSEGWYIDDIRVSRPSCCLGHRGNANGDPSDNVNVSDVTYLVDYLFGIPLGPEPPCTYEGNANGDIGEAVNISDVTYLVDYLFGIPLGPEPPACP
ncbi:MAG: choice-of-anchor J domain-containing protein [candidate division Zixibacteria bacterium]|nr:choice-of-anchor J domain-containing protein [candidate division Zixibacteria bacterium]